MGLFKKKPVVEEIQKKNIVGKMDQAIKDLTKRTEYHEKAIQARAVRQLEARLDDITEYMINNMKKPANIFSASYETTELFGVDEEDVLKIINILSSRVQNPFHAFLCDNRLTMLVNLKRTKVKFAYSSKFRLPEGWHGWVGYDLKGLI